VCQRRPCSPSSITTRRSIHSLHAQHWSVNTPIHRRILNWRKPSPTIGRPRSLHVIGLLRHLWARDLQRTARLMPQLLASAMAVFKGSCSRLSRRFHSLTSPKLMPLALTLEQVYCVHSLRQHNLRRAPTLLARILAVQVSRQNVSPNSSSYEPFWNESKRLRNIWEESPWALHASFWSHGYELWGKPT